MSWTTDLIGGLAAFLDGQGVGTYQPDGTGGSIVLGALPADLDTGIGIVPYNLQPNHILADVTQPVQLWLRGPSMTAVNDLADSIFTVLEGVQGVTLGSMFCPLIFLSSDVPQGVDATGRWERAVNYYIRATRPTASRPD